MVECGFCNIRRAAEPSSYGDGWNDNNNNHPCNLDSSHDSYCGTCEWMGGNAEERSGYRGFNRNVEHRNTKELHVHWVDIGDNLPG